MSRSSCTHKNITASLSWKNAPLSIIPVASIVRSDRDVFGNVPCCNFFCQKVIPRHFQKATTYKFLSIFVILSVLLVQKL